MTISADGKGYMTEERQMIREAAREFTMKEVLPVANALDGPDAEIPMDLRDKMAEMGYFGITIPEQYGGLGLGIFEYCLICEQLSRGWMSVASIVARAQGGWIMKAMPEDMRQAYLPRVVRGEFLNASALSEPDTGSDLASISCRAERDGDEWVLTGNKYWCTFADGADYLILFARTSPPPSPDKRWEGISCFMIEKERGSFPPGMTGSPIPKIGYFGWKTFELALDGVRVPARNLMGGEGKAFLLMAKGLEGARAHTAARAIGLAQGALGDAIAYSLERRQFGMPIAEYQAIRFKIATMATEIEAARQLLYYVCNEIDSGRRCDKEASMVKYFASEMAERVTSTALQIFGGAGYTKLFPVERYWRDARLTKIFEGTSEGYFEDFSPGMLIRHARGKTVTEMDNVLLTNMVMNTAEGHFNEDAMRRAANGIFSQRVVFGGINLSMVLGLAAQDTAEQCLREIGLDKIRLSLPVFHGDTLYAYSEVLAVDDAPDRADAGLVRFRHYGINQHDKLCVQAERTVLLKRKTHWGER